MHRAKIFLQSSLVEPRKRRFDIYLFIFFAFFRRRLLLLLWIRNFVLTDTAFVITILCGVRSMPAKSETNENNFDFPFWSLQWRKKFSNFFIHIFSPNHRILFNVLNILFETKTLQRRYPESWVYYLEGNNFFSHIQTHTPLTFRTISIETKNVKSEKNTQTHAQNIIKQWQNTHRTRIVQKFLVSHDLFSFNQPPFLYRIQRFFGVFLCQFAKSQFKKKFKKFSANQGRWQTQPTKLFRLDGKKGLAAAPVL